MSLSDRLEQARGGQLLSVSPAVTEGQPTPPAPARDRYADFKKRIQADVFLYQVNRQ